MKTCLLVGIALGVLLASDGRVFGNGIGVHPVIAIDEFGVGTIDFGAGPTPLPAGAIFPDPGPGGLPATLTYVGLPFPGVVGDVFLTDGGMTLDVLRFNGDGTIHFYSDNVGGVDAPADTPTPPLAFYANTISIPEIGPEGANGAIYTPGPGQPGYDPAVLPTYIFASDGTVQQFLAAVPLPASAKMGMVMLGLLAGWRFVRSRMERAAT